MLNIVSFSLSGYFCQFLGCSLVFTSSETVYSFSAYYLLRLLLYLNKRKHFKNFNDIQTNMLTAELTRNVRIHVRITSRLR